MNSNPVPEKPTVMMNLLELLKQSSTWKGIAAALAAFGVVLEPELLTEIVTLFTGVYGIISIAWSKN